MNDSRGTTLQQAMNASMHNTRMHGISVLRHERRRDGVSARQQRRAKSKRLRAKGTGMMTPGLKRMCNDRMPLFQRNRLAQGVDTLSKYILKTLGDKA